MTVDHRFILLSSAMLFTLCFGNVCLWFCINIYIAYHPGLCIPICKKIALGFFLQAFILVDNRCGF
jgi:hypothetical protein